MKKFYSFLFAAVALVGFAACNSDNTEEPAPAGAEKLSFKANIDTTKTDLEGLQTVWCEGDVVMIEGFMFVCEKDATTFTCEQSGCSALLEMDNVRAVYSCNGDGKVDSAAGTMGAVLEATGNLAGGELSFQIKNAFLKFTTTGTVTLKGAGLFYYPGIPSTDELEVDAGEHYVAINPSDGEIEFSYEVDGIVGKSTTITFVEKKIYNLGELDTTTTTTYLIPNSDWNSAEAWFAAYYYSEDSNKWVKATDDDADGVYECSVVGTYTGVTFCRMNPEFETLEWNKTDGDEIIEHHVWNEARGNDIPSDKYFYITNWNTGEWHVKDYEFPVATTPSILYMKPFGNGWGTWIQNNERYAAYFYGGITGDEWVSMTDSDDDGIYECNVPEGRKNVIFCRMNGSNNTNGWSNKWDQTIDLTIPTDGNNLFTVSSEKEGNNNKGSWSKK